MEGKMELKTLEDIKKELGNKVKFGRSDNVSENLKMLDVLEGTITKIVSNWEHTVNGDVCTSWTAYIDVVDPKDGGLHHLTTDRIFSLDEKDDIIINIKAIEEIAELKAKITALEASKISKPIINEVIEEEIV